TVPDSARRRASATWSGTPASMTIRPSARNRLAALPRCTALTAEDFAGQDLISVLLTPLRFTRCSFAGADLRHADLSGCSLKFCDLSHADLRGASLRGARLAGCDLRQADLRDADLTGAVLGSVNTGIPPHGLTDLTGARFERAILRDVRLEGVAGGPSWPPEQRIRPGSSSTRA
ncbi:pentapeptide repeat-containing protein, partial [Streptomyces sp. AK04-3B]|uniref:pentapeptide repeat-containing protein n=1 Tax=Streptomyces sp. AK04-3B TaxID=3028650 RepID=UPI0029B593FD